VSLGIYANEEKRPYFTGNTYRHHNLFFGHIGLNQSFYYRQDAYSA
jgi:hypothetical protein